MEDDIDIYADLPSLTSDKNGQSCNCEDIKKELDLLKSTLENIQKAKENLENNLFSLLKTAKAEIVRKDKMIDDLRKRLDDVAFRRNNKGESQSFSAHKPSHQMSTITKTYESVSSIHSYENENDKLNQTELHRSKYKSIRSEKSVDQISTVFGERLHKKIIKEEKEEKKVISLKLNPEINTKETSKENIVESDKENGSQPNINNGNESNIAMKNSISEISYRNNSERRMSEEDDTHETKRFKIEDDKNATGKSNYNFIVQSNPNSFVQNEIKDNPVKLEDRLDAVHSFKKEQVSFDARHRAISEHKDVKQDQYCTNEGRKRRRSNSRDRDNIRRKSIDRHWTTSVSERSNSGYKESNYRYNSRSRSYSRSRSNQESLSNNHLRIRSNSTYRNRKYDDCKNDSRYRSERSKRDYNSKGDDKTKCRSRERSNLRDTSRYVSSDIEDRESGNSCKNNKYEKHRTKEEEANVSDSKRSHNAAVEIDFQTSSRTVVNAVVNYSAKKDAETKSKSDIKSTNSRKLKSSITETADNIKETNDVNSANDTKITKMDDLNIKNAIKKEEINEPSDKNAIKISEDNNFITDSITCKIDEELSSTSKITKVEAVLNCDNESRDESEILAKTNIFVGRLDKCNTKANHSCLSDHNYNQNPPASANDFDAVEEPTILGCHKTVSETVKMKEMQLEEPVNVQSVDIKKTMSPLVRNKKDQQNKGIVISRRRKAVTLSDSNASMTVLMNTNIMKTSPASDNCNDSDSVLKPRACKTSRASIKAACK
nr:PREDICTED: LOW QUALITY PROTEIN: major antigen [Linepithema humile]